MAGHKSEVRAVAFSPDGKLLVTGGVGEAKVWDAKTGAHLRSVKHAKTVWAVAFSPDGKAVETGSGDPRKNEPGLVRVWNPVDGVERFRSTMNGGAVVSVAYSPDGKVLAAGRYNGDVTVWKVAMK